MNVVLARIGDVEIVVGEPVLVKIGRKANALIGKSISLGMCGRTMCIVRGCFVG